MPVQVAGAAQRGVAVRDSVVPEAARGHAGPLGARREEHAGLVIESLEEHGDFAAEIEHDDAHARIARRNRFGNEVRDAGGVFDGGADGPGEIVAVMSGERAPRPCGWKKRMAPRQ